MISTTNFSNEEIELINEFDDCGFFTDSSEKIELSSAYLHVTSHCNLKCKGCYSLEDERNKEKNLSFKDICNILNNLKGANIKSLVLSGGEVFLRKDIKNILEYAKNVLGIEQIIAITNGTLNLSVYEPCVGLVDVLAVSIDSYNTELSFIREEGIMPTVLNNAVELKKMFNLQFIATLHKRNITKIPNYMDLANRLQIPLTFSLFTVDVNDENCKSFILDDSDFLYLADMLEKNREFYIEDSPLAGELGCKNACGAGKELVSISSQGDIYSCHMFQDEQFKMGNALTDDILTLINTFSKKEGTISNLNVDYIDSCLGCENKYLCGGGCRFRGYAYDQHIGGKDPACISYLSEYRRIFKKLNEDVC